MPRRAILTTVEFLFAAIIIACALIAFVLSLVTHAPGGPVDLHFTGPELISPRTGALQPLGHSMPDGD